MWIEVQKMINENKKSKKQLNKIKMNFYLTNIADYLQGPNGKASTSQKHSPKPLKKLEPVFEADLFAKIKVKDIKEPRFIVKKNTHLK